MIIPHDQLETPIEQLNHDCFCLSLDTPALTAALDSELGSPGLSQLVRERNPSVFSGQPVFVSPEHIRRINHVVSAVEAVVSLPAYRDRALASAPSIARVDSKMHGVFLGYDFHLDHGRLGLIEINTNAGGAMLNALLTRAQRSCCDAVSVMVPTQVDAETFEQRIVDMFMQEWHLAGHDRPLGSIAIVDALPQKQYLYAEFLLFQRLFERAGIQAIITDPSELNFREGRLWHGQLAIDLVYNRLTDFYLDEPANVALRDAWLSQCVALTPHPQSHALYADKSRLTEFSNETQLRALNVPESIQRILLENVPRTEIVRPDNAERLWSARRHLFFKPVAGYGSRATYRGDKLTRRVWNEILAGNYVAQTLIPPGERMIESEDTTYAMKFDLRAYVYAGEVQWIAARLYQGQTTNFRTPGGGFAPVFSTVDASGRTLAGASAYNTYYPSK